MIASRNLTSHTYDEGTASRISARILGSYCGEFKSLAPRWSASKKHPVIANGTASRQDHRGYHRVRPPS